ncbi:MAG: phage Gp37/Gp68 family protein [Beijerinckiaceae bacterium]|nr:phage Gp37/Gp68 family protein [Beijerinckiaceae bacterium]
MAENSKIEWTHHTFNPWIGCTKVSPGCDHCYAETQNNHRQWNPGGWMPGADRKRTSAAYWRQPFKWDREAAEAGERRRVFCASLADVFDNQVPEEWRADLWTLIGKTPNLDWLLLTKRPQNIAKMLPVTDSRAPGYRPWNGRWPDRWPNVWLGTTVENQEEAARRIPHLLRVPAKVRFLSCEPLLGPVDLETVCTGNFFIDALRGIQYHDAPDGVPHYRALPPSDFPQVGDRAAHISWVICGGESGKAARPMHPSWARSLRDQCKAAGVAFHFKQWGEWAVHKLRPGQDLGGDMRADRVRHVCRDRENDGHFREGDSHMERVGKARAGRTLHGVTHNEFPRSPI